MTLVGQFQVDPDDFPLDATLAAVPDAVVRFVRVTISSEVISPYFWAAAEDLAAFHDAVERDPTVDSIRRLDTFDSNALYRAEWDPDTIELAGTYDRAGVSILDTFGKREGWFLRVQFPDRDALTDFRNALHDADVRFTTHKLTSTEQSHTGTPYGLTPKQTEAILRAWERGYYEVPRRTTLDVIADDLGISQQALSDRLHRAYNTLFMNTVAAPTHVDLPDFEKSL